VSLRVLSESRPENPAKAFVTSRDCSTQIPISLPVFRSPLLGNPALADRTHVHRRCPSRTPKAPERESDPDRKRNHAKHPNFHGVRLLVSNYDAAVITLRAEVRYEAILTILLTLDDGEPVGGNRPSEPAVRGDTASGGVTKNATLDSGIEIKVPLFIKKGEKVKVNTETREFAGRV